MAKRFIDTDIFKKSFIRGLDAPHKLLFLYLINDCNHAGIWECDWEVACIRLGVEVSEESARKAFGDKVIFFDGVSKLFIPSFIEFQYGELNEANRAHKSVIDVLSRYKLLDKENKPLTKPLTTPLQGCKDMDMDKDMDKDMKGGAGGKHDFEVFWDAYDKKIGDKAKLSKKWDALSLDTQNAILSYLPKYKAATADRKFRKNPETFLNNKSWNDEIIVSTPQHTDVSADKFKGVTAENYWKL